ncbi:L-type lectin-domain containing receptor kinase S.4-like protein [Tanacetum coccineum]
MTKTTSFNGLNGEKFLSVEFDVTSRVRVCNVTKISSEVKEGVKLATWIDYHAILRRLDVRVSKFGKSKPDKVLVSYRVNLGEMVEGEEEVLFGLVSSGGRNGENVTSVYSWWLEVKDVPKWMHSVAADPRDYVNVGRDGKEEKEKKRCFFSGFVFHVVCGVLVVLVLHAVWRMFVGDREKGKGEGSVRAGDFVYEKIGVVKAKDLESGVKK